MHIITISTKLLALDLTVTLILFLGFRRLLRPHQIICGHLFAPSPCHRCAIACIRLAGLIVSLSPARPSPGSFRNHHTIPFSSSRSSKAWLGGTLVTGNYQLAQMKWLLERPLKTHRATRSLRHPLALHLIPPPLFFSLVPI